MRHEVMRDLPNGSAMLITLCRSGSNSKLWELHDILSSSAQAGCGPSQQQASARFANFETPWTFHALYPRNSRPLGYRFWAESLQNVS
eukprot:2323969-Amphidinium_carterae.1